MDCQACAPIAEALASANAAMVATNRTLESLATALQDQNRSMQKVVALLENMSSPPKEDWQTDAD